MLLYFIHYDTSRWCSCYICGLVQEEYYITHVAVLHGSDIRPQAAVCGCQQSLHARLQLIQHNRKVSEVIHLER